MTTYTIIAPPFVPGDVVKFPPMPGNFVVVGDSWDEDGYYTKIARPTDLGNVFQAKPFDLRIVRRRGGGPN